jgi:hypothetical protein
MGDQPGVFNPDERHRALSAAGDALERRARVVDFELFRVELEAALTAGEFSFGTFGEYDWRSHHFLAELDPVEPGAASRVPPRPGVDCWTTLRVAHKPTATTAPTCHDRLRL